PGRSASDAPHARADQPGAGGDGRAGSGRPPAVGPAPQPGCRLTIGTCPVRSFPDKPANRETRSRKPPRLAKAKAPSPAGAAPFHWYGYGRGEVGREGVESGEDQD